MSKKLEKKTAPSPRHILKLCDIQKATNNFDESLIIGRGWYGNVYLGEVFNVPAAVKRLNQQSMVGAKDSWPEVEKQGLCTLRHPNLVSLIAYCNERSPFNHVKETILVNEFISNGTLKDHLHARRTPLSCLQRLEICVGVARGIRHLHDAGVMHGDVRSSNIFLTDTWVPKVADFGLSKLGFTYLNGDDHFECHCGMYGYLDGYSLEVGGLTMRSDVYSFGVLLLEVLCRKTAMDASFASSYPQRCLLKWVRMITVREDLKDVIDWDLRNQISPECLIDLFDIAKRCTDEEMRARPTINEVVDRLETVLTLQERFSNPVPSAPRVKEFAYNDLEKSTRGFSQDSLLLLDQAGSWKVYQGWVENNTSDESAGIAVAIVSIATDQLHNDWLEEVKFLEKLAHPNIIRLLGHCIGDGDGHGHLLVYEHLEKSLSRLIRGGDHLEPLSWKTRLNILIGVARGLKHLCTVKGVHCNFLIDDILLDENLNAKFGGFGYVEIQQRYGRQLLKGVFGYLKAEYDPINSYLPMDDVCSFGLVLLETITAKHPDDVIEGLESLEMRTPMCFSNIITIEKMMDPRLKDYSLEGAFSCMELALRCLAGQPECKPSVEEIKSSLEKIYALNN